MPNRDIRIRVIGVDKGGKKLLVDINGEMRKMPIASKKASKGTNTLGSSFKALAGTLGLAITGAAALRKGLNFIKKSTLLAGRVDTLGVVTENLGENAGYTSEEINKLEKSIAAQGITMRKSRESLALMMQAQLDLTKSTDLARMAQDAAVISNTNSSEAFQRLVYVISSGSVRMARRLGIIVSFQQAYEDFAAANDRATESLTAQEKIMIRTNAVLEQGSQIAGTYEAAMETVGKKVKSLDRLHEEFGRAFGQQFQAAFSAIIDGYSRWLKVSTAAMNADIVAQERVQEQLGKTEEAAFKTGLAYDEYVGNMLEVLTASKKLADTNDLLSDSLYHNIATTQQLSETEAKQIAKNQQAAVEVENLEEKYGELTDARLKELLAQGKIDRARMFEIANLKALADAADESALAIGILTKNTYENIPAAKSADMAMLSYANHIQNARKEQRALSAIAEHFNEQIGGDLVNSLEDYIEQMIWAEIVTADYGEQIAYIMSLDIDPERKWEGLAEILDKVGAKAEDVEEIMEGIKDVEISPEIDDEALDEAMTEIQAIFDGVDPNLGSKIESDLEQIDWRIATGGQLDALYQEIEAAKLPDDVKNTLLTDLQKVFWDVKAELDPEVADWDAAVAIRDTTNLSLQQALDYVGGTDGLNVAMAATPGLVDDLEAALEDTPDSFDPAVEMAMNLYDVMGDLTKSLWNIDVVLRIFSEYTGTTVGGGGVVAPEGGAQTGSTGFIRRKVGGATGLSMIVPPGFPGDSFGVGVTSGERVTVETQAQQRRSKGIGSSVHYHKHSHVYHVTDEHAAMVVLNELNNKTSSDRLDGYMG